MNNEFNADYQYDRCISRGICSINPTTSSLQEIIIIYLKQIAYYGLKLDKYEQCDVKIQNLILNTLSILSSNYEISNNNFETINSTFLTELPRIIEKYKTICKAENIKEELLDLEIPIDRILNINDYIRLGEKAFYKRTKDFTDDIRSFYRIIFIIVKSIAINILTYESFEKNAQKEFKTLLETINILNSPIMEKEELKELIYKISECDCDLIKHIRASQIEKYGEPSETEVSFSTTRGKCALVVGSNIKELEEILDKLENHEIDIYTHDNMILAHTFPFFKKYKNLKGQYGKGMENCLLDFSTFPGPIILTRHSLFNVENLYRGRLFTTDFSYSKGVIPITNHDFSPVIQAINETRGFKTGKQCPSEKIGYSLQALTEKIQNSIGAINPKKILIIASNGYSAEEKEYFNAFYEHIPSDIIVISQSCIKEKENRLSLHSSEDIFSLFEINKYLHDNTKIPIEMLFPYCDRHTLSVILNFNNTQSNIYIGTWNQTVINPNIIESLKKHFNIKVLTSPKKDLEQIIK